MNINWNQLVKYLSDSKPITIAVFVTSIIFVIDNSFNIQIIPKLPDSIYIYAFGVSVFSGSLLVTSAVTVIYQKIINQLSIMKTKRAKNNLSPLEAAIVIGFKDLGSGMMYSHQIVNNELAITKMDVLHAVTSLEKKGILKVSHDRNVFWLVKGIEPLVIKLVNSE